MILKNKKAEKLLSLWWFFVLGVIGGGIVIGVSIYSPADTNVNEIESEILGERILNCIIQGGYLTDFGESDILEQCNLDEKMFGKGSDFYFKIEIYRGGELNEGRSIEKGDFSIEKGCPISLSENLEAEKFPKCFLKKENVLSETGEILNLILLVGSNQKGEKGVF